MSNPTREEVERRIEHRRHTLDDGPPCVCEDCCVDYAYLRALDMRDRIAACLPQYRSAGELRCVVHSYIKKFDEGKTEWKQEPAPEGSTFEGEWGGGQTR